MHMRDSLRLLSALLALLLLSLSLPAGQLSANSSLLLNELKVNPPGTDNPLEYVELIGTPASTISDLFFVSVEGEGAAAGTADMVVALNGRSVGANGLLVLKSPSGGHLLPAETGVVTDTQFDNSGGGLENGGNSFLLIASATALSEGVDYDANNDGTLELPSGATIQDAVGWSGGAGDLVYGGAALAQPSAPPDAATRLRTSSAPRSAAAWYNGNLAGSTNASLQYDPAQVSANFPSGGVLTPGAANLPDPSAAPQPILPICGGNLVVATGVGASRQLTASDFDSRVLTATLIVTPTSAAIGLSTVITPAVADGASLTATLLVSAEVSVGSYDVTVTFENDDAERASCNLIVSATDPAVPLRVHTIQGAGHTSPLSGSLVSNLQGIVTAVRSNGFYLQDAQPDTNPATSEGIFVFTRNAPGRAIGDSVVVTGTVDEFRPGGSGGANNLTTTEISLTEVVQLLSVGNPLPAPITLGQGGRIPPAVIDDDTSGSVENPSTTTFDPASDAIDFYESLEGMLVQVNDALAVGPTSDFGEIPLVPDGGSVVSPTNRTIRGGVVISPTSFNGQRIILDDTIVANPPTVNVGDRFSTPITGVIDYSFANFKLLNSAPLPAVTAGGLAKETLRFSTGISGELTVATFNVENLAATSELTKFNALAGVIVGNLKAPDIIALEEIQDNNGATNDAIVAADLTYSRLISAVVSAGGPTYAFRQIDPVDDQDGGEPGGNIRVGFLFNPARVSFVDRPGATATAATSVVSTTAGPQLSLSPGRIDPTNTAFANSRKPLAGEFVFAGQPVFIVANHFSSKGGDEPLFGRFQPPTLTSEARRIEQAQVVNSFVDAILALDPQANIIVLGDINDFEFAPPLAALEGDALTSLVRTLPKNERYTYNFEGNAQVLDHILVSAALLADTTGYDIVHVNSEFADQVSDHDPQVARFALRRGAWLPLVQR